MINMTQVKEKVAKRQPKVKVDFLIDSLLLENVKWLLKNAPEVCIQAGFENLSQYLRNASWRQYFLVMDGYFNREKTNDQKEKDSK